MITNRTVIIVMFCNKEIGLKIHVGVAELVLIAAAGLHSRNCYRLLTIVCSRLSSAHCNDIAITVQSGWVLVFGLHVLRPHPAPTTCPTLLLCSTGSVMVNVTDMWVNR